MERLVAIGFSFMLACSPSASGQDASGESESPTSKGDGDGDGNGDGDGDGDGECTEVDGECTGLFAEPCCEGAECRGSLEYSTCVACVGEGASCAGNWDCCAGRACVDGMCGECLHTGESCSGDGECCGEGLCEGGVCNVLACMLERSPISAPDLGDVLRFGMCDPGLQDCPNGEKCTAHTTIPDGCCVDANKCVADCGDKKLGDVCMRWAENDDCAKGLFCLTEPSGGTGPGVCAAFCNLNDPQSCANAGLADGFCAPLNQGAMPLCLATCHPLEGDCPDGEGCYFFHAEDFGCVPPQVDDGEGNDGDDCWGVRSCNPGLSCQEAAWQAGCETDACCTPYCDCTGDGSECTDPMEECVCLFEMGGAPEGYAEVGACGVP